MHRTHARVFREAQLEVYQLKISGRRKEAAEKAAEYTAQYGHLICPCGCGQRPVF